MRAMFQRLTLAISLMFAGSGLLFGQETFTISGTVSGPGFEPVSDVIILMYTENGDPIGQYTDTTDLTGFYSISQVFPGNYGVSFRPSDGTYAPQFINITVGSSNMTFNLTLEFGYLLSGIVRNTLGVGIEGIDLNVYDQTTGDKLYTPGDNSDADGFYDVVIPSGLFRIAYRPVGGEMYVPIELENVPIAADTAIDVVLEDGFYVTGIVLGPGDIPVESADIDAVNSISGVKIYTPNDNTDENGEYTVMVPSGTFDITVAPPNGSHLLPGIAGNVIISQEITIVDFNLTSGYLVSGIVSDSDGAPVDGADIDVVDHGTGEKLYTPGDNTDASGLYQVTVPDGLYDFIYQPPVVAPYLAPEMLSGINITKDTIINVVVSNGILLSGTVQNSSFQGVYDVDIDVKDPISGVEVPLSGDHTDLSGDFAVVLMPQTYNIEIEPPKTIGLVAELLPNVTLSQDTGIVITLVDGIFVSGTASDSLGSPISNVEVDALFFPGGDTAFTPENVTDSVGFYEIIVSPDTYSLNYTPDILLGLDPVLFDNVILSADTVIDVVFAGEVGTEDICGDANSSGTMNLLDITFLIAYLYKGGPAPEPLWKADVNASGSINLLDVTHMISYLYKGGPAPDCL